MAVGASESDAQAVLSLVIVRSRKQTVIISIVFTDRVIFCTWLQYDMLPAASIVGTVGPKSRPTGVLVDFSFHGSE